MGALPANWIKSFNDAQLDALVEEALQNNLNLQAAASQVEAAGGLVTQAGAQMKPVVAAVGDSSEQKFSGGVQNNSSQGALSMSWELDIWGKIRSQKAAADSQFEAVTADYEFARLSLKAQLARSWFTAVEMNRQLKLANEVVELYQRTYDIVFTKYNFGDLGMKEVHLARADLASAKERVREVDGAYKISLRAVELILGRYPSAELDVSDEFVAVPPAIPVGLPSSLIERRPDLVAAERRVAAAFSSTQAAKAARLPSIGLTGSAGGSNSALTDLLGSGGNFWSVGANFLGPIYSGGALKADVRIANAEQEGALAQFGQKALVAFGEVETALNNEDLLAERAEFINSIVTDNQQALELAQTQFEGGSVELLDVLQMQARLVASKVAQISMQKDQLVERINLHLAIGGDFAPEGNSL